jgi:hypothetical protein
VAASNATLRTLFAQQLVPAWVGVGNVAMPLAVPGDACEGIRRPIDGLGVEGFAGNQTVPSGAAAIPILVL